MRVVLDTNILISGLLWAGTPGLVLKAVDEGKIQPLASEATLDELRDVLSRPKFAAKLAAKKTTAAQLTQSYADKTEIIDPAPLPTQVASDPDDDMFIACAISGKADLIVSGDPHLLHVEMYKDIPIITAAALIQRLKASDT
jgi:putative PIN family toxin of toxin-antitoxin system